MSTIQGIPPSRTAIVDVGGTASRPWYLFFQNVSTTLTSQQAQIDALVEAGGDSSGGLPSTSNVIGQNSILSQGVLANGIVTITLAGDVGAPGNTYYYGTNGTGVKSFYSVASAFLGTTDNITLTVGSNGVTTVSIASTYPGQTSITTLGTITTGTWHGTTIDAAHGGTGHASYAVGDLLYADTTSSLARVAATTNGYVLTLVSGIPVWEPAASGGVTSITAGTGLSASPSNPITTSGTLSLSPRGASTLMGNPTASSATPTDITIGSGLNLSVGGVLSAVSTGAITLVASENITGPALVNIWDNSGTFQVRNANATNNTRPANGFVQASVSSGGSASVSLPGSVATGFSGLTQAAVYLSMTNGLPTSTPTITYGSGNLLQGVGTAISSSSFIFLPDGGIVL